MSKFVDSIIKSLPLTIHGYQFTTLIGRGSFGCVVKATKVSTGHCFAAKIIYCQQEEGNYDVYNNMETACLTNLLHFNIIKIYDIFREVNYFYMILEFCSKGSLDDVLRSQATLSEIKLLSIMKQIINAVCHCHSQGIAHRDIKPANILISDNECIKLTDFGISARLKENQKIFNSSGSFAFMAPELFQKMAHDPIKADIWSLGVTFYVLLTKKFPWGATKEEAKRRILLGIYDFPDQMSAKIVRIIKRMLIVDPEKRVTACELLEDPCFTNINISFNTGSALRNNKLHSSLSTKRPSCYGSSNYKNILARSRRSILTSSALVLINA